MTLAKYIFNLIFCHFHFKTTFFSYDDFDDLFNLYNIENHCYAAETVSYFEAKM